MWEEREFKKGSTFRAVLTPKFGGDQQDRKRNHFSSKNDIALLFCLGESKIGLGNFQRILIRLQAQNFVEGKQHVFKNRKLRGQRYLHENILRKLTGT